MELDARLKEALEKAGYATLTEIQEKAIPIALSGKDLVARSSTGTGKTAAFLVPILNRALSSPKFKALVLEPSRELAIQAANEGRKISQGTGISIVAAYGGTPIEKQAELVNKGAQVVIGTLGRARELWEKQGLPLKDFSVVVLDEADRLLAQQFAEKTVFLVRRIPRERQTMLFSVQMPADALKTAETLLKEDFVQVKAGTVSGVTIEHEYAVVEKKTAKLAKLLPQTGKSIVFCATTQDAAKLRGELDALKIYSYLITSDSRAQQRNNALKSFKKNGNLVLIATDLAARGIHVQEVDTIFSFGLPSTPEFYIHRAGRTGRMGRKGKSIALVSKEELKQLKEIYSSLGIVAHEMAGKI